MNFRSSEVGCKLLYPVALHLVYEPGFAGCSFNELLLYSVVLVVRFIIFGLELFWLYSVKF